MAELSPVEGSHIAESVEAKAWRALIEAVPADTAQRLGLSIHRHDDFTVSTCVMFDDFVGNRAFGLDPTMRCSTSTLSEIVAHFRSHRLRNYALQINPIARPEGLSAWLNDHGLERRNRWAIVLRDDRNPPELTSPYEILQLAHDDGEAFAKTTAAAFGWPAIRAQWMAATVGHRGWHHYMAYASKTPVAAGALFVADDIGWLGMAGTLAAHRHHGAHTALLARRIRDAIQMGCRWIVAETGEANPSYRHLLKTGFSLVYWRDNFCEKRRATDSVRDFSIRVKRAVKKRLPAIRPVTE